MGKIKVGMEKKSWQFPTCWEEPASLADWLTFSSEVKKKKNQKINNTKEKKTDIPKWPQ